MEARHFKEIENEHNHWWWNNAVGELDLKPSKSITRDTTCANALDVLKSNGLDRIPVNNENG